MLPNPHEAPGRGGSGGCYPSTVLTFLAIATVAIACASAPRRGSLPGGLPRQCLLPDCALPGDLASADEAALAALDYLQQMHSDWTTFEYAGCIFKDGNVFKASLPVPLAPKSSFYCLPPPTPAGTTLVADYHNHTITEDFSRDDKSSRPAVPHYLLTPSKSVKRYTPADGLTVRLR